MDDIIQKIIDIEKNAQAIVDEAREERRAYEQTMESEIGSFRENTEREYKAKADRYAAQMKRDADEAVRFIDENARQKIEQMREITAVKKGEWIERLYNGILFGGAGGDVNGGKAGGGAGRRRRGSHTAA